MRTSPLGSCPEPGLAAPNTLASSQHAQMLADREALITTGGSLYTALRTAVGDTASLTAATFSFVYHLAMQLQYPVPFLCNERRAAAEATASTGAAEEAELATQPAAEHPSASQRREQPVEVTRHRSLDDLSPAASPPARLGEDPVPSLSTRR